MEGGESAWESPACFPQGRIPRLLDLGGVPLAEDVQACSFLHFQELRAVILSAQGEEHLALLMLKEICSQQVGVGGLGK